MPVYEPVSWDLFWDSQQRTADGFLYYRANPSELAVDGVLRPYVFLLHGAGYSSLSWSLVAVRTSTALNTFLTLKTCSNQWNITCLNLSYCTNMQQELKNHVNVVAYDLRGHGGTRTEEGDQDFSLDTLSSDSVRVITEIVNGDLTTEGLEANQVPKIVVIGHSMGGAIAAKTASLLEKTWLKGLVLIDIVEGTAIAALPSMHKIIASRPTFFASISDAIHWSVKSKTVSNSYSARVSVPSQIVETENPKGEGNIWTWRTDLNSTEPYWKGMQYSSWHC